MNEDADVAYWPTPLSVRLREAAGCVRFETTSRSLQVAATRMEAQTARFMRGTICAASLAGTVASVTMTLKRLGGVAFPE